MPGSSSVIPFGPVPRTALCRRIWLGTKSSYCWSWGPQSMLTTNTEQRTHIGPSLYFHREGFSKTDSQI